MLDPTKHPAVYIDFEGQKDERPVLLGILVDDGVSDQFTQHIIDPRFYHLAPHGKSTITSTLLDAVQAVPHEFPVYAWSSHEETVLTELADGNELILGLAERVINAITIAEPWAKKNKDTWYPSPRPFRGRHTLDQYMARVEYKVPTVHGPMKTGARIATTLALLEKEKPYDLWTGTQKSKWTNLLQHNRHDCYGMQAVLERIWTDTDH